MFVLCIFFSWCFVAKNYVLLMLIAILKHTLYVYMHLMHVSFELHRSFAEDAAAEFAEMVIE